MPPIWDPEVLAAEVHRVAKKGCHAITFPENPVPLGLPSLHDDAWDPVWKACSDEGTIVCMHIGSSGRLVITAADAPIDVMITLQPMNIVQAAADLIHSPVFKKFPDVTVALSEGGIGWIPYFLERLDHSYVTHKEWTGADFGKQLPSEVFMEHVILCFIEDEFGVRHAREIGVDRICIETDYPHSDAIWPNAPEVLTAHFALTDLTDDEIDKMTHRNAMEMFRYDPFSVLPKEQCTVGALRAQAAGHDVSVQSKGRRAQHDGRGERLGAHGHRVVRVLTAVEFDPYSYEIHEDPYPTYRRLRDEAPAYYNEKRELLGASRATTTCGPRSTTGARSRRPRASRSSPGARASSPTSSRWTRRGTRSCARS